MTVRNKMLATAVAFIAAGPAVAGSMAAPTIEAEIYTPPAPNAYQMPVADEATWDGAYVGGSLGNVSQDGFDGSGMVFGLHAGYNLDLGDFVVGAEAGYQPVGYDLDAANDEMKGSFSAKLKAGYDAGDFLPYATIGMKRSKGDIGGASVSGTGMTYGVGIDYRMTETIVVGGEISKVEFSDFDGAGTDVSQTSLLANVSYRF